MRAWEPALPPPSSSAQRQDEVVGAELHALREVEAVGAVALDAGVEEEAIAVGGAGLGDQPVEELAAVAGGADVGVGDQVVDVHILPRRQALAEAVAGDGDDA